MTDKVTVAELIVKLQTMPGDALVVQSRDAEGNGYDFTRNIGLGRFDPDQRAFGLAALTDEDRARGYGEEDVINGPLAVCLWP
jgi:hypothetical protein